MIFSRNDNIVTLTQERASITELVKKIEEVYDKIKNDNLIVNLSSLGAVNTSEIIEFLNVSNTHRAGKQSFVIVTSNIDLDTIPDEIIVVPTLQEAHDLIEMEEMERDLDI